jgi:HSP20 family protein
MVVLSPGSLSCAPATDAAALRVLNHGQAAGSNHSHRGRLLDLRSEHPGSPGSLSCRRLAVNEPRLFDPAAPDPIEDAFRALMRPWRVGLAEVAPRIKIDLSEEDGSYLVKAEIPGVRKEDIDVRIDGDMVMISAETKSEKQEKDKVRVLCKERREGYASRSFTLACPVDEAHAEASYTDGVLALKLPKRAPTSTKRLAIQ